MIREGLSEEGMFGLHRLPGRQRARLRAQEVPSPSGEHVGDSKKAHVVRPGSEEREVEDKVMGAGLGQGCVLAGTVGTLNVTLREVGTWGLRWRQR